MSASTVKIWDGENEAEVRKKMMTGPEPIEDVIDARDGELAKDA